jgi:hypothetical protein
MYSSAPRRTLSLEPLEYRIAPAGVGLSLPGPLAELTSQVGLVLPALSLTLPSQGHSGLSLGLDVGILALHAGLGSGGGLLSLGLKLDLPVLPPLALQAGVGSPQGLVSVGVVVDPPALPPVPGVDPGAVSPPANVPPVVTPPANVPPVSPHSPPASLSPAPTTGGPSSSLAPLFVAAPRATTPTGVAFATDFVVTGLGEPVGTGEAPSATPLHSPAFNDLTFASFSAFPPQPNAAPSPRAESGGDDFEEELFRLRDGQLLQDFGTALGAEDAALLSAPTDDAFQGESDNAMALWLVGVLAGCVAGSAWLTRRREEAAPEEADPSLIPLG